MINQKAFAFISTILFSTFSLTIYLISLFVYLLYITNYNDKEFLLLVVPVFIGYLFTIVVGRVKESQKIALVVKEVYSNKITKEENPVIGINTEKKIVKIADNSKEDIYAWLRTKGIISKYQYWYLKKTD